MRGTQEGIWFIIDLATCAAHLMRATEINKALSVQGRQIQRSYLPCSWFNLVPSLDMSVHKDSVVGEVVVIVDDVVEVGVVFSAVKIVAEDAPAVFN